MYKITSCLAIFKHYISKCTYTHTHMNSSYERNFYFHIGTCHITDCGLLYQRLSLVITICGNCECFLLLFHIFTHFLFRCKESEGVDRKTFPSIILRDCVQISVLIISKVKSISFYYSESHQKTYGFLMILGGTEVK